MEIKNKNVLITGASRGIGRAFALACAKDKANVHLILRKEDSAFAAELEKAGAKSVQIWIADLGSRSSIDAIAENLKNQNIDILFNNAGVLTGGIFEQQPLNDIYNLVQVNIAALIHLTHLLLPGMIERKRGKIINNSSVSAYMHFPCATTYAASKAAVMAFTNCLSGELKGTGVSTLLLITPGIKTKMYDDIEVLYGKNFDVPQDSTLTPARYAEMIREAVIEDLEVMEPSGATGWGLKIAKYLTPVFNFEVQRRFKR